MKTIINNGHKISEFTLGTVQLGLNYGINNSHGMPTEEESADILKTALSCGVISFDTARAYGESEAVLGRFFGKSNVEKTIITKVRFDDTRKEDIKESLLMQINDSMKKLALSKIPFIMLHNEQYIENFGDTLADALLQVKEEGLVSGIGISFSDKSNMEKILDKGIYDIIQIPQNIFDSSEIRSGLIKKLGDAGVAIFVRSVYLQGLFFKDTNTLPNAIRSAKKPLDKLHAIAEEENMSVAQLAMSFIKDEEGVSSLVLGCEEPKQIEENAKMFSLPQISTSVRGKLLEIAEEIEPIVIRPWEWNK